MLTRLGYPSLETWWEIPQLHYLSSVYLFYPSLVSIGDDNALISRSNKHGWRQKSSFFSISGETRAFTFFDPKQCSWSPLSARIPLMGEIVQSFNSIVFGIILTWPFTLTLQVFFFFPLPQALLRYNWQEKFLYI